MTAWSTTGPLRAKSFSDSFFPEQGVDLAARSPRGTPLWSQQPQWVDGQTHRLPTSRMSEATYLFRTITAKEATTLPVEMDSDDGLEVWLNGQKLISRPTVTTAAPVDLALKPDENRLLVKIYNISGDHSYRFAGRSAGVAPSFWEQMKADFPLEAGWFERHAAGHHLQWFANPDNIEAKQDLIDRALRDLGPDGESMRGELEQLAAGKTPADDPRWLSLFERVCRYRYRPAELRKVNVPALRRAIDDLAQTYGGQYGRGGQFLAQVAGLETQIAEVEMAPAHGQSDAPRGPPASWPGSSRCGTRRCWPIRCSISTSCCWSSADPRPAWACRRTGRAMRPAADGL